MRMLSVYSASLDDPDRASPLAASLVAAARDLSHGILCTYEVPGNVVALGRYHVVPPHDSKSDVAVVRRIGGGRPAPLGAGYVGIALALPDRSALLAEPTRLTPEQVLNRYVRGLLGALESLGIQAYYPGRDVVTVGGRIIASIGFEIAGDGATLVESCVAVGRSFAEVSRFVDRVDPAGVVPVDIVQPEQATSVADASGREPDIDELTAALAAGYAARVGCEVVMSDGPPPPAPDPSWVAMGRLAPHLDRHAAVRDLLGVIEVYASRGADVVADVRVCGDLLAPSGTVERVEAALRGAPIDREDLGRRVVAALTGPDDVLLGVRSPATVGDLVFEACRS